jgi:ribosomal-protein-alanine N-acetyltransferase
MTEDAQVKIRSAEREDVDAIARIQAESPEGACWEPASYLDHGCLVAVLADSVAGFVVARRVGLDEMEILNIAVAPEFRRRGVARALLAQVLRDRAGRVFLEVRESNTAARTLYAGAGFRVVGVRQNYYREPPEAAIVMGL